MAKYLVVIDCAPTAKAALAHAASKVSNGDKITVLSIYTPPGIGAALVPSFDSGYMKHQKQVSVEEQRKHAARKLLYKAKEILESSLKSNGVRNFTLIQFFFFLLLISACTENLSSGRLLKQEEWK